MSSFSRILGTRCIMMDRIHRVSSVLTVVCIILLGCCHGGTNRRIKLPIQRKFGDWLMVFRARAGNGQSVLDSYLTPGVASELDVTTEEGCLSFHGNAPCTKHYRHGIIDSWISANVKKVRLELFTNGKHVAHVIFNAEGTTSTNWFSKKRVISSSWTDLKSSTANFFSFFGDAVPGRHRRMFINKNYGGCHKDQGWMVVLENHGPCPWENRKQSNPVFKYSPFSTSSKALTDYRKAEVLAIYVMT